jgi:thiol-disulfide isomerase/thioredoxin
MANYSVAFAAFVFCMSCGYIESSGINPFHLSMSVERFARIQRGLRDPVNLLALRGGGNLVKPVDTKDEFDKILSSSGDKLVVVDFTAVWCGPCQKIAPFLESLASQHSGVVFLKVSAAIVHSSDCQNLN